MTCSASQFKRAGTRTVPPMRFADVPEFANISDLLSRQSRGDTKLHCRLEMFLGESLTQSQVEQEPLRPRRRFFTRFSQRLGWWEGTRAWTGAFGPRWTTILPSRNSSVRCRTPPSET
jgi:hypothetical protein